MNVPIVPLGELCQMDRQGLHPDDPIASGLPFVGVEHVESDSGAFNFNNGSRIGSQRSTAFRFDERHILYAKLRPYLNKVATPEFAGRCSTELVPLLPRDGVEREFIAYLLRRNETVDYVMSSVTGARMPRTNMKALMSLPVPLPSLDEQRRLVGILNQAAKIERLRARAQERLREFIPALFVKMFGDPSENPMGWEERPLGRLALVGSGAGFPKKEQGVQEEKLPFLKVSDMNLPGNVVEIEFWNNTISEATRQKLRAREFSPGSVIFPKIGAAIATNKKRLLVCPSCVDNNVMAVTPDTNLDSWFLYGLLLHKNLSDFASESEPPSMRKTTVEDWYIPFPPFPLQRQYAKIIESARVMTKRAVSAHATTQTLNVSLQACLLKTSA